MLSILSCMMFVYDPVAFGCFVYFYLSYVFFFFFFKQKTAYEMRISDWSSDVCSSDLWRAYHRSRPDRPDALRRPGSGAGRRLQWRAGALRRHQEIGRASCRERVCQYV